MTDAVFEVAGASGRWTARATPWAAGPWDPGLMHGGAPSALIAWAAEQVETPAPMRIARLTIDLLRPAPVTEYAVETEVLRQGRKIQLLQVRLTAGDVEVTRGTVLKVRTADLPTSGEFMAPLDEPLPEAGTPSSIRLDTPNNFGGNFEMRSVRGGFGEPGPAANWFRQHRASILGQPISPAMRAASVADFSNGISSVLPFDEWTFINGDLTVSFARPPRGEWILSNAVSWIAPDGGGLAMTRLADVDGYFGVAQQSLVVERR
ncbi:thioesterase family protein [Phenylobacterium sp.]|uniref:thioesterase family protein n=1 Tax=Phenylobacterium sp. TaxID=1871053 RepID=UPI0028110027|nr:thioesterase family protein [Phenylobacterium sp.]